MYKGYFPFKYYNFPLRNSGRGRFGPWLTAEEYWNSVRGPTTLKTHFWLSLPVLGKLQLPAPKETLPLWGLSFGKKILPVICSEARLLKLLLQRWCEQNILLKKLLSLCFHTCADLITHVITQSWRHILLSFAFWTSKIWFFPDFLILSAIGNNHIH